MDFFVYTKIIDQTTIEELANMEIWYLNVYKQACSAYRMNASVRDRVLCIFLRHTNATIDR